jgi:UrcA family protein
MRTILLTAALVLAPLGAVAAEAPDTVTIKVTPADLRTEQSLAALMERIEDAADSVCKREQSGAILIAGARSSCRRTAVSEAIRDADIEALTVFYTNAQAPAPREMSATLASR